MFDSILCNSLSCTEGAGVVALLDRRAALPVVGATGLTSALKKVVEKVTKLLSYLILLFFFTKISYFKKLLKAMILEKTTEDYQGYKGIQRKHKIFCVKKFFHTQEENCPNLS